MFFFIIFSPFFEPSRFLIYPIFSHFLEKMVLFFNFLLGQLIFFSVLGNFKSFRFFRMKRTLRNTGTGIYLHALMNDDPMFFQLMIDFRKQRIKGFLFGKLGAKSAQNTVARNIILQVHTAKFHRR